MAAKKGQTQSELGFAGFGLTASAQLRLIRLSPAARYALQGMVFLAEQSEGGFCLVEDAAKARGLPKNYLSKIFQKLSRRGFLVSQRGPGGGYALARPAREIALAEIVRSLEEPRPAWRECADGHGGKHPQCLLELRGCGGDRSCFIHEAVLRSEKVLRDALEKASLADIAHHAGG